MTTFHVGDCSNSCNECAMRCARNQHRECIGTDAQRAIGDAAELGYQEGLGALGMTYDDSPYSARSVAYDHGRTVRQSENGGQA